MNSDILVIGGGIAGISAAARLSGHASVTVLEGEEALGYHASGRSAAMFEREYGNRAVRALNHASEAYHETANGGVLSPRGIMMVARADKVAGFRHEIKEMHLQPIDLSDAFAKVPILNRKTVAMAAASDGARDLDADRLLQNFAGEARRGGASIHLKSSVIAITHDAGGWHVESARGSFSAPILVNAAGPWVDEIARMAGVAPLGFTPFRRSMAQIPAPGGHDVTGWPMLHGAGESWYAKPDAGKLLVSPSEEHPMTPHDAWADDMVLAEGLARYEEMVNEPVTRLETSWAGLRTFSPDRALVIGRDSAQPDFFWLAGQGGYGFQTAPAASQLARDLILGAPPDLDADLVADLSPARFAH